MKTQFSAGPHALGYLYQARHALYALMKEERDEAALAVEGLDDVSLDGAEFVELQQLKHHIKKEATLTDASPELWKTIRIWSEDLKNRKWKATEVKLRLITTAKASAGSIGAMLCEGEGRDADQARLCLLETANKSTNEKLTEAFKAFKKLSDFEQTLLIESIVIADGAPNIEDLTPKIKNLFFGMPVGKEDQIYEMLEGWWFDRVAKQLLNNSDTASAPIMKIDLRLKAEQIASQFHQDSLPIHFAAKTPEETYFAAQKTKTFWRQMECLAINTSRMKYAVIDYYRAFEQRTKWAKDKLLVDDELDRYEVRLQEEWQRYVDELADEEEYMGLLHADEVSVKFGREVFKWISKVNNTIRTRMPPDHEFVIRGSLHLLADKDQPPVYWHPNFLQFLDDMLAAAAAE
jgi:hypothetical protein